MNANTETPLFTLNNLKWLIAVALLAVGFGANYYFASQPLPLRLIGWLVLIAVVALVVFQTAQGQRLWVFSKEARIELRKVVWPTRQETLQTTLVVVAMVLVMGLFLWAVDSLLLWAVGFLSSRG